SSSSSARRFTRARTRRKSEFFVYPISGGPRSEDPGPPLPLLNCRPQSPSLHVMALRTDRERGAHLLRRFGLGASEAELDFYLAEGLNSAVDKLLNYEGVDEGFALNFDNLKNPKNGRLPMPSVTAWWASRMIVTKRPLQEKMTLFWHNHFATSAVKVNQGPLMLEQNETLRRNATGNFRTMLKEISKDPAMLLWLDNRENVRGHAN